MRLIRFESGSRTGLGALAGDEGSERVLATPWTGFEDLFALPDPLAAVRELDLAAAPEGPVSRRPAPVAPPARGVGVGGNYADPPAEPGPGPREPVFFPFLPGAVIGPDED